MLIQSIVEGSGRVARIVVAARRLAISGAMLLLLAAPAIAQVATRLADIAPGPDDGYPLDLTRSGSFVYFDAWDPVEGRRLWRTDGTGPGTIALHDPQVGGTGGGVDSLTDVDGTLFFAQNDGSGTRTLWKTDGTVPGTVLVSGTSPDPKPFPYPVRTVSWNGLLYFFHEAAGHTELWKSDGTTAGTVKVVDAGGSQIQVLAGRLYWLSDSDHRLWTSDGTAAGTYELLNTFQVDETATCPPPPPVPAAPPPTWCWDFPDIDHWIVEANGIVYVAVTENEGTSLYVALWTTDGTVAGTHRLRKISEDNFDMANIGGTLILAGEDLATGNELWTSDGSVSGTTLLKDIVPGSASSSPHHFVNAGGTLWFLTGSTPPRELWTSDGTAPGTVSVSPLPSETFTNLGSTYWNDAFQRTPVGTSLFFTSNSACGSLELWKSEGPSTGIRRTLQVAAGSGSDTPQALPGGALVFVSRDEAGVELWSYDGATPPPDSCDDGVLDAGEGCDLGAANGTFGSCCECTCRPAPAGTECAASTGGCDLPEICDGTSGTCPVPTVSACGNGIVESGEQCDEGAANGNDSSCCACDCTLLGSATVCRPSTGACDPEETCTGTSGECPADIGDDDVDADGICDSGDACVNGSTPDAGRFRLPQLRLSNIKGEARFKSDAFMPDTPAIDPPVRGARLLVLSGDDSETIVDATVPPGNYDPVTRTGWRTAGNGRSWTYYAPNGPDGLTQLSLRSIDKPWNMKVKATLQDRTFDGATMAGIPHPLHLVLVIDSPLAATGQCAEIRYNASQCTADGASQAVRCE